MCIRDRYTDTVDARELNWIACDALGERPVRLLAKLRYRQPARRATAWQTGPDLSLIHI